MANAKSKNTEANRKKIGDKWLKEAKGILPKKDHGYVEAFLSYMVKGKVAPAKGEENIVFNGPIASPVSRTEKKLGELRAVYIEQIAGTIPVNEHGSLMKFFSIMADGLLTAPNTIVK